ncbi:GDSL esterase/lipase EXL3-like [Aristolochia californica]|uniref:GDSL esterase/lipase EXL3-like n=1 Tax=Aristolochia californica TaxID=171875 RepID=UPI0035DA35AE
MGRFWVRISSSSFLLSLLFILVQMLGADSLLRNHSRVPALIAFGDSIVDPGNNNGLKTVVKCNFPPYGRDFVQHRPSGRFSNGKIPSDLLASSLGIKELLPAYLDPILAAEDLLTGVSFASGGSGYDPLTPQIVSVIPLEDQVKLFGEYISKLEGIAGADGAARIVSDSVYLVISGSDDLANTYFSTPFRRAHYDIPTYTDFLVQKASIFYQELYELGARKVAIAGAPPVGCLPSQRTIGGGIFRQCQDSYNQAARLFNSKLSKEIDKLSAALPGARMVYVDIYKNLLNVVLYPSSYGFKVSNKGCCGTGTIEVTLLCNELSPHTCTDVDDYVFWDSYHPTEKAYKIIIDDLVAEYLPRLL